MFLDQRLHCLVVSKVVPDLINFKNDLLLHVLHRLFRQLLSNILFCLHHQTFKSLDEKCFKGLCVGWLFLCSIIFFEDMTPHDVFFPFRRLVPFDKLNGKTFFCFGILFDELVPVHVVFEFDEDHLLELKIVIQGLHFVLLLILRSCTRNSQFYYESETVVIVGVSFFLNLDLLQRQNFAIFLPIPKIFLIKLVFKNFVSFNLHELYLWFYFFFILLEIFFRIVTLFVFTSSCFFFLNNTHTVLFCGFW
jgi:hypothetical protein